MAKELVFSPPSEKQKLFLEDRHKYVCFGGARGGGKSWVIRLKAVLLCLAFDGIKVMIIRRSYPELTANHIKPLVELLMCYKSPNERYATYNDSKKTIHFSNGSEILFQYCSCDRDLGRLQGTEMDVLFLDEATQFEEEVFKKLAACVRGVNDFPKRIYITCNPGGVGHQWVKRLFIDRCFENNENPDDYSFIQSLPTDNYALMKADPDYIKNLEALPSKIRSAWLEGDWEIFSGQFFEEWRNNPDHYEDHLWTHVIDEFFPPLEWKIYRSYDHGYSKPFSVGWYAEDFDGTIYRIAEWYGWTGEANEGMKIDADQIFKKIREIEHSHPYLKGRKIRGTADPAIWSKNGAKAIIDYANKHKIWFEKGNNERIAGWNQCHYRLAFDENGRSKFYVFKTCKQFIRTIPLQVYDDHKVEDLDTELEDHICDEWRYLMQMRTIPPRKNYKKIIPMDDPLDIYKELKNG